MEKSSIKKNIMLRIQYDGTMFFGYQVQNNKRTVQGVIEESLLSLTGEKIRIRGCSRTDAGVHAENYILNFFTESTIPPDKFMFPLNDILPEDVKVMESREVSKEFDSRNDAKAKIYSYSFLNSKVEPVIGRNYISFEKIPLNYDEMKKAVKLFEGEHDFKAFMSEGSSVLSTVRTIFSSDLKKEGDKYTMTVKGNGFLYNMVRIMAGTLIFVGQGTRSLKDVREALKTGERKKAGKVAPARGLVLKEILYGDS